jgi:hypothetical protein
MPSMTRAEAIAQKALHVVVDEAERRGDARVTRAALYRGGERRGIAGTTRAADQDEKTVHRVRHGGGV